MGVAAERVDVAIVGAGPAGSTAAYRLAAAGARVVLLDRQRFPRDKPCGGGLTMRGVGLLPFDVSPVVEDRVDRVLLRLRFERSSEQRFPSPIALMTQRRRLDHFLVERAGEAGADVRDGVRVRGVEADGPSAMVVDFEGGRLRAALVLGADGANGVSAKALGLGADRAFEVAYEGNLPVSGAAAAEHRGRVILEIGTVPGGYGWIFPKGDHLNVGVGGWAAEGPRLRAHLDRLCAEHGIEVGELTALRGHRLPLRRTWSLAARGRAAVVGDAAGLVDPLSGDGIFEAFLSAKLASEAALDVLAGQEATMEPYQGRLRRALAGHAATAWAAKLALERSPALTFHALRSPIMGRFVAARLGRSDPRTVPGSAMLERSARLALGAAAR
ncbi:MAG TPA: geranylgeranyl reductase family protein [Miltoncostaeaceae bacterium]|nr:geranylgeranyl reductase family protein [Miltoncostaeaceae bacterium]